MDFQKIAEKIMSQKYQIIDDFFKAYVASFPKDKIIREGFLQSIELVEQRTTDPLKTIYFFRIKE